MWFQKIKIISENLENVFLDLQVANSVEGFVSVSNACIKSLQLRAVFEKATRKLIYNGSKPILPQKTKSVYKEFSIPYNSKIILMLGVYEPRKGHSFIFKVMEKVLNLCPETYLLICGYGSNEEFELVNKMRKASSASSYIHLSKHRNDVTNLLSQINILVVPSQEYESFGYTALEAMNCEIPVVVSDIGGLPEVVDNGVCGYVINHKNVEEFAKKICCLITDDELSKNMGKAGRIRSLKHFTSDRMVRSMRILSECKKYLNEDFNEIKYFLKNSTNIINFIKANLFFIK